MATPVYFVLLPQVLMLDLAGPAEVLRLASRLAWDAGDGEQGFDLRYLSPLPEVESSIGLPLAGLAPLPDSLPTASLVVLLGSTRSDSFEHSATFDRASALLTHWLREVVAAAGLRVICVCSGALSAARAGLLDGRQCTTHHGLYLQLQALAPTATVLENRLYVTDGCISSSAGVTAGIDLMLHVVAQLRGPQVACAVARDLVVYMRRAGGDPQLSPWLSGRNHLHPALHRVQDAMAADPAGDWTVQRMAALAFTSARHLGRLFSEQAGVSPLDYLNRLRVALARELLSHPGLDMESIAQRAGFGSARHLRRIWAKYEAAPPSRSRPPG
jgi:transcriptional regulator GlxA family with amidase domain